MKISVTYLFALFFFVTFYITFHNVFVADALAQYIPSGATIKKDLKNNVKSFSDDLGGDFQQISGSNQAKRANRDIQGIIPKEAQTNFPDGGRTRTSYSANIEPVQPLIDDDMKNFQGSSNFQQPKFLGVKNVNSMGNNFTFQPSQPVNLPPHVDRGHDGKNASNIGGTREKSAMDLASNFIIAARNDDIKALRAMINFGVPVDIKDKAGNTGLIVASNNNAMDSVRFLLFAGADVNEKNKLGLAAIHMASYRKNLVLLDLLVKAGADVGVVDIDGNSVLMAILVAGGHSNFKNLEADFAIAEYLISKKIDVNRRNLAGFSPFHYALINGKKNLSILLLENGADSSINMPNGIDNLDVAVAYGFSRIADMIREQRLHKAQKLYAIAHGKPSMNRGKKDKTNHRFKHNLWGKMGGEISEVLGDDARNRAMNIIGNRAENRIEKRTGNGLNGGNGAIPRAGGKINHEEANHNISHLMGGNMASKDKAREVVAITESAAITEDLKEKLNAFIEADANFDKLPFFAKKEWDNYRRNVLMKAFPEYFEPPKDEGQRRAYLQHMVKWENLRNEQPPTSSRDVAYWQKEYNKMPSKPPISGVNNGILGNDGLRSGSDGSKTSGSYVNSYGESEARSLALTNVADMQVSPASPASSLRRSYGGGGALTTGVNEFFGGVAGGVSSVAEGVAGGVSAIAEGVAGGAGAIAGGTIDAGVTAMDATINTTRDIFDASLAMGKTYVTGKAKNNIPLEKQARQARQPTFEDRAKEAIFSQSPTEADGTRQIQAFFNEGSSIAMRGSAGDLIDNPRGNSARNLGGTPIEPSGKNSGRTLRRTAGANILNNGDEASPKSVARDLIADWLMIDAKFSSLSKIEKIEANIKRKQMLDMLLYSEYGGQYSEEFMDLPEEEVNRFLGTMEKWDKFEASIL